MANLKLFPFDGTDDPSLWFDVEGSGTISLSAGRNGGYGYDPGNPSVANLGANISRFIMGGALRDRLARPSGNGARAFVFRDSGSTQVTLHIASDGSIRILRGGTTVVAGPTAPGAWPASASTGHHYLEWDVTVHNTAGAVTVWVDGVQVLTASGLDTAATVNNYANQVEIGEDFWSYDDVYVNDDTGAAPWNGRMGDIRMDFERPTSDDAVQFTPLSGASNAAMVDDPAPDHDVDATYNSSSTAGHRDTFNTAGGISGSVPLLVAVLAIWRKDDAASRSMRTVLKSGGTVGTGPTRALGDGYSLEVAPYHTDPSSGSDWQTAGLAAANASKPGYEVVT